MAQLFNAALDKWELRILDISDTMSMAMHKHEFIGTDGALVTTAGMHPREIKFRAFFFGTETQSDVSVLPATYLNHFDFVNYVMNSTLDYHELRHPKYGVLHGFVETITITHDDTQDYAAIDISFVQKDILNAGITEDRTALDKKINQNYIAGINGDLAKAGTDLTSGDFASLLSKTVVATQSLESQFQNVNKATRDFLKAVDTDLAIVDAFFSSFEEPANTLTNAINFVNDVPSRIVGALLVATNRCATALNSLVTSPAVFINSFDYEINGMYNGLKNTFMQDHLVTVKALSMTKQVAYLVQIDFNNSDALKKQENVPTFDLTGQRIYQTPSLYTMTVNDLENLLYVLRLAIEAAVLLDRTNTTLKQMAATMANYISDVKIDKKKTKVISVTNMPIHLMVFQLGLPYNAAERTLTINTAQHEPTFLTGQVTAYVS